jgi:hypothetical protein
MPGKITKPNAENWYMHGSGIKNHFGAGVNGPRDKARKYSYGQHLYSVSS